jgi:outer membrane protein assembly factor BamA
MRKTALLILFISISVLCFSQNKADSVKKRWNIGYLPAIAYDSDLGLYYGLIINPFDYGDYKIYPNYYQKLYLQVSGYSKGSSEHALEYTSYTLLPSLRFFASLKYQGYKAYPFYGYNGNEAIYNHSWEDKENPAYKTQMYYRIERKHFRLSTNLQDTIGNSKFQWQAGWTMGYFKMGDVNIGTKYPDTVALYKKYVNWGLISPDEKDGGVTNSFLVGLIYDTRNQLTNPDRGIFSEINIKWSPSALTTGGYSSFSVGFIHRQYFTLVERKLVFAYRIWYNATLFGDSPFYARQILATFTTTEGYGGTNTLRGVLMQRIVTRDFLMGTAELRSRLVKFRFIKQDWFLGAVAFSDAGRILRPVHLNMSKVPSDLKQIYFGVPDKSVHVGLGLGIKLVMNENFVLSAEYARPLDAQDGISGLYLGLNYQF